MQKDKRAVLKLGRVLLPVLALVFVAGGIGLYYQQKNIPGVEEIVDEIVSTNPDAVVSIGIWQDGQEEKYSYTAEGRKESVLYRYQIGSITKTFTGAMLAYEEAGKSVDLSEGKPSLEQLVTHRSGLADQWEQELALDPGRSFGREELYALAEALSQNGADFRYSNLGSAVAGTRAAEIYGRINGMEDCSYQEAMSHFIRNVLELKSTEVGGEGDFSHNWEWQEHDEMMAAGAITSDVPDLLKYGQLYLDNGEEKSYLRRTVTSRAKVDEDYDIGMFWMIDRENDVIWHNGELAMDGEDGREVGYQSFLGISPKRRKIVVVLSNVIAERRDGTACTDLLGYLLMEE